MFRSAFMAVCALSLVACVDDEPEIEDIEGVNLSQVANESTVKDLLRLALETAKYHSVARAEADGHVLVPGLDHCFENPGIGAMGYHYIDTAQLDLVLETTKPEAMVYHTAADGERRFGAVEYIVPAAPWDAEHPDEHPKIHNRHLHLNAELGVYVLHVWLWKFNPDGLFEDWNPNVSCP